MKAFCRLLVMCAAVAVWSASVRDAHAAVAQQVQSGTAVNNQGPCNPSCTPQTITISGVNPAKSVLFFSTRHNGNRPVNSQLRGRLGPAAGCSNPCTTIEFDRVTDENPGAAINIQWYVVTFGSGVNVQRNEFTIAATTTDIGITPVAAVSQAFVLWSKTASAGDGTFSSDDPVVGELTTTSNLQFRVNVAGTHTVAWQVVEFTNAADINVQKSPTPSLTSMTAGALTATATLSPAVNPNKTFVLAGFNTNGTGADIGARMLSARLTNCSPNCTTITFERSIPGDADDMTEIAWQAVELKDASIVWGGSENFASGTAQKVVYLTAPEVNTTRAVAFGSVQSGGGQNMGRSPYAVDDIIGVGTVTASLGTASSGIAFRAAASAGAASGVLTLTITKPAGTVENDVMIASIGVSASTPTITKPSAAWTLVRQTNTTGGGGTENALAVYYAVAGASEPANYAWTFSASTGSAGGIQSFSGVNTTKPIDVENGTTTASSLTHATPSVSTTADGAMIVTSHTFASAATWTPPTGPPAMAEAFDVASGALGAAGQSTEGSYVLLATAGATGTMTATASANADKGNAHILALNPADWATSLTLTRDSTVDTADIGWFVVQFAQGSSPFKVGSFTKSTGGAPVTQVIAHGLGEKPKAIILWTVGKTNQTGSVNYLYGFGMTDGTTSRSVATASQDAVSPSNVSSRMASKVLTIVQWGEVLVAEADLQSWDDTNFTLNWTTNNATAYVIHYVVIGGSDVSAKVVEWTMATATGNQSIAGVGFQPNVVLHSHAGHLFTGASGTSLAAGAFGLGAMDADGDQWAVMHFTLDGVNPSDTQRGQQTDGSIYSFDNALAVQKKASWVSMNADGFTVNFTNATSAAAARVFSLALKGVNVKPGSFLKSTGGAPASQPITGVGFQPSVVLLTSFQDITRAAPVAQSRFGIGASDGTTQGSSAQSDANASATTDVTAIDKTSKVFMKVNNNSLTINAEANLTSLDTDGFTLNWTTNDAVLTQILYLGLAPAHVTEVRLLSFTGTRYDRGVLLQWKTGYEIDNLGFHVYREINGVRTRVDSSIVAGSGLMVGAGTAVTGERNYAIWDLDDASADPSALYWLEDVDLTGKSSWNGPVSPVAGGLQVPPVVTSTSLHEQARRARARGRGKERIRVGWDDDRRDARDVRHGGGPQPREPLQIQWALAAEGAVKIGITRPGWYRIVQPELVAAGLSPAADPRRLRLFADGVEQAFRVVGEADGRLDGGDAIEFFATGVDTPYTDTRIYWLVPGQLPGRRLGVLSRPGRALSGGASFWYSLQHKERLIYFAALRNGDEENWFGQLVSDYEPSEVTVRLSNVDHQNLSTPAEIELALQGVTVAPGDGPDHRVAVLVNGREIDEVSFNAQERPVFHLALPPDVLQDGDNVVGLVARGGEADFSLVDYIRISYWHSNRADADQLLFTANSQQLVNIGGFSAPSIRVVDVTDPSSAIEVRGTVRAESGLYAVTIVTPGVGERRLLAFTDLTIARPAFAQANRPSSWHEARNAFDYVLLARREFFDTLRPLVELRERQGYRAAIVDIEDVYDEFSFGEKTPAAIRQFLAGAVSTWQRKPRFAVLAGDATIDPRDYAGFGDFDLIPTKQVPMASVALETASDEWFADFDDDGLSELAVGRLPVRSVDQAGAMVSKIVGYETQSAGSWINNVTLVADENDSATDFEANSRSLASLLPGTYRPHEVFRGVLGERAHTELATQVMAGQLIVNYQGHGSVQIWGQHGDLSSNDEVRSTWHNGTRLPFVIAMNCLNGFFHGIYDEESLAEALLRTPDGGAVAAWASSSLTPPATQLLVNQELFRLVFQSGVLTLGEAVAQAKRVVSQRDVRRSWIFFGDPAMRLLGVGPAPSTTTTSFSAPAPNAAASATASTSAADTGTPDASASIAAAAARRVELADFDGDRRADLLVYRPDAGEWQIWTAAGRLLRTGQWSLGLEVRAANFNGDRLADLFLYEPLSGGWFQLLNSGGTFRETTGTTLADAEVHVGDLDGDGDDDVLLYQSATGRWAQGAGDGQGRFTFTSGRWAKELTVRVADFDGDGLADIFTYQRASGLWRLMLSRSKGGAPSVEGTTRPGREPSVANLDGDPRADLLFYDPATGRWETWTSRGPGAFQVAATGTWVPGLAVHIADFTGDGVNEALLYEPRTGAWAITPLRAAASGLLASGFAPPRATLAIGDVDRDGFAEAYVYQPQTGAVIFLNPEPAGTLQLMSTTWPTGWTLVGREP